MITGTSIFSRLANRIVFVLQLVILALLPIPFGSYRPWAWSLFIVVTYLCSILLITADVQNAAERLRRLVPKQVTALFILSLVVYLLQLLPLPKALLAIVSPATSDIYLPLEVLSIERFYTLGIDRQAVLDLLLLNAAYILFFFNLAIVLDSRLRVKLVLAGLFSIGFAHALYALAEVAFQTADSARELNGFFANRNHFALHLGMTIAAGLGLLMSRNRGEQFRGGGRQRLNRLLEALISGKGLMYFMLIVMVGALLATTSRGGVASLVGALALASLLLIKSDGGHTAKRLWSVLLVVGVGASAWLGVEKLAERITGAVLLEDSRWVIWSDSVRMIADFPLFGVGGGNFRYLYPGFRSDDLLIYTVAHAHNDYLQLVVEFGLVGSLLLLLPLVLVLKRILRGLRERREPLASGVLFASVVAIMAMALHAMLDFNMRIPANAAYFFAFLAIGLVASRLSKHRDPVYATRREVSSSET